MDIKELEQRAEGGLAWLRFAVSDFSIEPGVLLEDLAAAGLRYRLNCPNIKTEFILLQQDLLDTEGVLFPKGFKTVVDLAVEGDNLIVFEVIATRKASDADFFAYKVDLVRHQNPEKNVRGLFINLGARPEVRKRCEERGIELLD